jgi:hypothetical protein
MQMRKAIRSIRLFTPEEYSREQQMVKKQSFVCASAITIPARSITARRWKAGWFPAPFRLPLSILLYERLMPSIDLAASSQ